MRKLLAWYIIPVCLFLVMLGMRVPNVAHLLSAPKPHPRAVIETTCKSAQDTVAKDVLAAELSAPLLKILPPAASGTPYFQEEYRFSSVVSPPSGARAPPLFC